MQTLCYCFIRVPQVTTHIKQQQNITFALLKIIKLYFASWDSTQKNVSLKESIAISKKVRYHLIPNLPKEQSNHTLEYFEGFDFWKFSKIDFHSSDSSWFEYERQMLILVALKLLWEINKDGQLLYPKCYG